MAGSAGALGAGFDDHALRGEFVAIDKALDKLRSGDLCLVVVDQVVEAIAHIEARIARG